MSRGPKGPLSPPQELEVGGRSPPYLLVVNISATWEGGRGGGGGGGGGVGGGGEVG